MTDESPRHKADKHTGDADDNDKGAIIKPHPQLQEELELEDELPDDKIPHIDFDYPAKRSSSNDTADSSQRKYIAYTVKLPSDQLAALQSIWLELKRLYGANSPDKSGMIQQAVEDWLRRWEGQDRNALLEDLLEIRQDTRKRQYRKY
jgi:hypothetical protein